MPRCQQLHFLKKGFTLIELMVTISILGILAAVATPSLKSYQRKAQITSAANNLVAAINAARSEGMKRNLHAYLTPNGTQDNWALGWRAFIDVDFSGNYSTGDILITEHAALPDGIEIESNGTAQGNSAYILYDGSGFSKNKNGGFGASTLSFKYTDSNDLSEVRRIKIAATGRIRVCTPKTEPDSACSSTTSTD